MNNYEHPSNKGESQNKVQLRENFGSKVSPSRTMGNIDHSPGYIEQKYAKESHDNVKRRHRLAILPPLSKLKIEGSF